MRRGFSILEVLTTFLVAVLVAGIAVPRMSDGSLPGREKHLAADLEMYRTAITLYRRDTGLFPQGLADLSSPQAPRFGLDLAGMIKPLAAKTFNGPYLSKISVDPVSNLPVVYKQGLVRSSASGKSLDGTLYSGW